MYVVATAGHVDHGKSTLVERLTGTWPDRLAEEQRRGLTIELGFAWTEIDGRRLAFVDVPGHERFVPNMLAGVGPVPAVVFVVAADEGWMPQSAEHLAALDALGVRHALLVVTKADLADPWPATAEALSQLAVLGSCDAVAIGRGADLAPVRRALCALVDRLPGPDPAADVRLWVDRAFTVRGAGTVVTGTLAGGTLRAGDELELAGERVSVRGLQSLGAAETEVTAVARVAVNLRGVDRDRVRRGDALLTPGAWVHTSEVDVAVRAQGELHRELVLHLGAAAVPVHVRPLGTDAARLRLREPLPLRIGDAGLLRDPGEHRIAAGVTVLDVRPPPLRRRGAARARAAELAAGRVAPPPIARASELRAMGFPLTGKRIGEWIVDDAAIARAREEALSRFDEWSSRNPVAAGMPVEALRQATGLPTAELVPAALEGTGLVIADGLVRRPGAGLPAPVLSALARLDERFRSQPFRAPEADDLAELGLSTRELAAAVRAGRLTRIADGVFLGPDAVPRAAEVLGTLPQPFTVSEARRALDTTRRVAVPLLELLDARAITARTPDSRRHLR
ncbi:SelB C-terminal domain-containing protein [Amycolatopsis methanolica]|uniref:Selenocysteine-specific translation elongation factor SelB n=1 Tax=Amycolatopsis methanolica 239 TaxID=1068978 RepID=A0A076N154_AMYME|nr:SelB C-terminal domain-containing protein [Amycolatopsis methanolica]AIJ26578.1 selenocysteine-specific translation elongation factor SelB [Amycolatopsis methanolica 239]